MRVGWACGSPAALREPPRGTGPAGGGGKCRSWARRADTPPASEPAACSLKGWEGAWEEAGPSGRRGAGRGPVLCPQSPTRPRADVQRGPGHRGERG